MPAAAGPGTRPLRLAWTVEGKPWGQVLEGCQPSGKLASRMLTAEQEAVPSQVPRHVRIQSKTLSPVAVNWRLPCLHFNTPPSNSRPVVSNRALEMWLT